MALRPFLARFALGSGLAVVTVFAVHAQGQFMAYAPGLCGSLDNGFGPYDYRTIPANQKRLVEGAHFPPTVESLRQGHRSHYVGGDIDYTLRAIPNHPRALNAMTRLGVKERRSQPVGATYSVECYYDRAIRFAPDDPWPKALYAIYLIDNKRNDEARSYLSRIDDSTITDPQLNYNLGLAYFALGDYARAENYAKKAYDSGIEFPGLRDKINSRPKHIDK